MKITTDKFVAISYELHLDSFDGELIEQTSKEQPESYITGRNMMLDAFEEAMIGKSEGDSFRIHIPKEKAFGEYDPAALVEYTREEFEEVTDDAEDLEAGSYFPVDDEEGNRYDGFIAEINDIQVIVDFNHPLAGEDLYFIVRMEEVRDVTKADEAQFQ